MKINTRNYYNIGLWISEDYKVYKISVCIGRSNIYNTIIEIDDPYKRLNDAIEQIYNIYKQYNSQIWVESTKLSFISKVQKLNKLDMLKKRGDYIGSAITIKSHELFLELDKSNNYNKEYEKSIKMALYEEAIIKDHSFIKVNGILSKEDQDNILALINLYLNREEYVDVSTIPSFMGDTAEERIRKFAEYYKVGCRLTDYGKSII